MSGGYQSLNLSAWRPRKYGNSSSIDLRELYEGLEGSKKEDKLSRERRQEKGRAMLVKDGKDVYRIDALHGSVQETRETQERGRREDREKRRERGETRREERKEVAREDNNV